MDWTAVGALGELVGAIAVVASLVYVGRQVSHNNTSIRLAAKQEMTSGVTAFVMGIASNPELAAAFAKVHFDGLVRENATDVERIQIAYAFVAFVGQMNLAYDQTREGALEPNELESLFGSGSALLQQPYLKSLWPILRPTYPEEFAHWFEKRYNLVLGDGRTSE